MNKYWKFTIILIATAITCYAAGINSVTGVGEGTSWPSFTDQISKSATKLAAFRVGLGGTPQALSGAGAVNVTALATKLTTTGASQALTLADGTNGQLKVIIHDVDGGSAVLTPTTKTGFSTITFTAVGESATLMFVTTRGWIIIALNGAVAA